MSLADWKDIATIFQSTVTPLALIVGGIWAYRRYVVQANKFVHIETSSDISFIGRQGDFRIVQLTAVLNNKGGT